jgi:hypothetical protein
MIFYESTVLIGDESISSCYVHIVHDASILKH